MSYRSVSKKKVFYCTLVIVLILSLMPMSVFAAEYDEISDWAIDEVDGAIEEGIVPEELSGDFQRNITRQEFAMLMVKTLERLAAITCTASPEGTFSDTTNEAVRKAHHEGIVTGITETKFAPNSEITREQMAVMLMRMVDAVEDRQEYSFIYHSGNNIQFEDVDSCSPYAFGDLQWLVNQEIISGVSGKYLEPKGKATVEQAMLMTYRLYGFMDGEIQENNEQEEDSCGWKLQYTVEEMQEYYQLDDSERTNEEFVAKVVELTNEAREQEGLPPLGHMDSLAAAAQERAVEQEELYSHTRPDGSECFTILDEYGVEYSWAAENIAQGYITPKSVVNGWLSSEGHRKNILNENHTKIGVGYYRGEKSSYWVQLFVK